MESKFDQFKNGFITDVETLRAQTGDGLRKSFVQCMSRMIDEDYAEDVVPVYLSARCGMKHVMADGYAYSDEEGTLVLIAADFKEFSPREPLTKSEAEGCFRRLRNFFELSKAGRIQNSAQEILEWSSPEFELAELIRSEDIERVRLLLYTDRTLSGKFKKLGNEPIGAVGVEEQVWSMERLYEHFMSGREHEPLVMDFSDAPLQLAPATKGDGFKSYLGVMPAEKLARMYRDHGGRLLEGNVRSFLTLKSKVNQDIRGTILRDPEHFFIFNNGIAATARDLVFNDSGELVQATDFQIINGGQTTASLSRAVYSKDNADVSNIRVALKLTEIESTLSSSEATKLVRNISRYSNNQNKVSAADFTSNHEFHVMMEKCAERIAAPVAPGMLHGTYWFYERNRGAYLQKQMFMTAAQQREFEAKTDKKHVVKKEDLARVRLAWEQLPHIVSKGAAALFAKFMERLGDEEEWEQKKAEGLFGDQYYKDSISLVIIYNQLRAAVAKESWYDKGYLANIVAYAMSVFSWLFSRRHPDKIFNFDVIWRRQELPAAMLSSLVDISRIVKEGLIDPDRPKENVTEWAKLNACWLKMMKRFEDSGYVLAEADDWCRSDADVRKERAQARAEAKVDDSVSLISRALAYGHWTDALDFNRDTSKGCLNNAQEDALMRCSQLPRTVPGDQVLKAAFEAIELLRKEGFKF